MNKRLAKVLLVEAVDLERTNPIAGKAMRCHVIKYMTKQQYNDMWLAQDGKCAICHGVCSRCGKPRSLAIDHDHETGKVRSLLCAKCNMALGLVDEDIERLKAMISYLERHKMSLALSHIVDFPILDRVGQ